MLRSGFNNYTNLNLQGMHDIFQKLLVGPLTTVADKYFLENGYIALFACQSKNCLF